MIPILTPYQELQARTIGRFIGLAKSPQVVTDPQYVIDQLVKIADEYNRKDAELLNALPRTEAVRGLPRSGK